MTDISPNETAPARAPAPVAAARSGRALAVTALVLALVALSLLGWHWHENRTAVDALRQELAKKLSDADTLNKGSRALADQAREASAEAQVKLGVLESR